MLRILLLTAGVFVVVFHHCVDPIPVLWQQAGFLAGIVLLGIPHGAADMLVGAQNAVNKRRSFAAMRFLFLYLARLGMFGFVLWLVPVAGIIFFIFFAAYHFGETDLFFFETAYWPGKLLVFSYGLVILTVILFNNLPEVADLLRLSGAAWGESLVTGWATQYRQAVLSLVLVLFFCSVFLYFLVIKNTQALPDGFLLQFTVLVLILYNLPLIAGFTFYFVVWHAVLSLRNIVDYLKNGGQFRLTVIIKQIALYSTLAMTGIVIAGTAGFLLLNMQGIMMYLFAGLAVLTAPHMQVMHQMYHMIRANKKGPAIKEGML